MGDERRGRRRRRTGASAGVWTAFFSVVLAAGTVIPAERPLSQAGGRSVPTEYEIKAVFLYNFTRYIAWPASPGDGAFTVTVFGESEIIKPLREIAGKKTVGDLPLVVRICSRIEDIGSPRILFVAKSETARTASVLKAVEGRDVLTVGEAQGLAWARGVAVNFVLQEDSVKFEISEKALAKTGLKASSQLMKLAILVDPSEDRRP